MTRKNGSGARASPGVRSVIGSPGSASSAPRGPAASPTSPAPPPGGRLGVSGIHENRTIACDDNVVSVSGVSNAVVITGHCARVSVSGVRNAITVDSVDASGFDNKVTYHSGEPKISNSGDSNVVERG
jgi:hypothetical protein